MFKIFIILIKYPENPRSHIVPYIIFHSNRVQYIFKVLAVLITTNILLTVHFSYTNSSFNRKSSINPPISLSIHILGKKSFSDRMKTPYSSAFFMPDYYCGEDIDYYQVVQHGLISKFLHHNLIMDSSCMLVYSLLY